MNALRLLAAVLAASCMSLAAAAESKPAAVPKATAAPSATATEVARALVPKEGWAAGVTQISQGIQQQLQSHPGASLRYPADFPDKIRAEVEKVLPYDEFVSMHASQLASTLSETELKEVLAFYRTPTGQKWQRDVGKVSQAVSQETQKRFSQKMPEVMSRLGGMAKAPAASGKDGGKGTSASPHGTAAPKPAGK